jgi:hypothetical protein
LTPAPVLACEGGEQLFADGLSHRGAVAAPIQNLLGGRVLLKIVYLLVRRILGLAVLPKDAELQPRQSGTPGPRRDHAAAPGRAARGNTCNCAYAY